MEPEMRTFLLRIVNTMLIIIFWMLINATIGIMLEWGLIYGKLSLGNIIFYSWLILSLVLAIWWIIQIWKKPIDFS